MAFAPTTIDLETLQGQFKEREHGMWFEYRNSPGNPFGVPHEIYMNDNTVRYARVLKTVALVIVDEDANGLPVVEKWKIRHQWRREQ